MSQPVATVLAALAASMLGGAVGALTAWLLFRRQRGFDRRLTWYEGFIRSAHQLRQDLQIALTFLDEKAPPAVMNPLWHKVQVAQLQVDALALESEIFGSEQARLLAHRITELVDNVAEETAVFDTGTINDLRGSRDAAAKAKMDMLHELPDRIREQTLPLAKEARHHLGLR